MAFRYYPLFAIPTQEHIQISGSGRYNDNILTEIRTISDKKYSFKKAVC